MDAVRRVCRVVFELLIRRPAIPCVLSFFYIFSALVGGSGNTGPGRGMLVAVLAAIPAAGLCAITTERLVRYAASAGALGVPRHTETLRAAQIAIFLLLVAFPWLIAIEHDAPWLGAAALLLGGLASGTLLVGMGWLVALLIPLVWIMNAEFGPPEHWLAWPALQWLVVAGSLAAFWRWMQLPLRMQLLEPTIQVAFADAGHEESEADMVNAMNLSPPQLADFERKQDNVVEGAVRGVADGNLSSAGLALGLGFWSGTAWRAVAICSALGVIAVTMARNGYLLRQPQIIYVLICLGSGFLALSRVSTIVQRWKGTAAEQGLLRLTPLWPPRNQVRSLFLVTLIRVQGGAVVGWLAISAILLGLKWIDPSEAKYGALYVIATSLVASSYLWVALGSREVKEWQFSAIVIALLAVTGVVLFQFGAPLGPLYRAAGAAAVMIPALISYLVFRFRPLQFPANPKSRKADV